MNRLLFVQSIANVICVMVVVPNNFVAKKFFIYDNPLAELN